MSKEVLESLSNELSVNYGEMFGISREDKPVEYPGDPASPEQALKLHEHSETATLDFVGHSDTAIGVDIAHKVLNDHTEYEVYFGGEFPTYVDTMYIVVGEVDKGVKEYVESHFLSEENNSWDNIDGSWQPEVVRYYEDSQWGDYVYLWWD